MADKINNYPHDKFDGKTGSLPCRAPLAVPYIPFQDENPPMYDNSNEALNRGTVFPGLDLPWMNTVNRSNPYEDTLTGDLFALEFAVDDLQLYLDTHEDDKEVFEMFKYFQAEAMACKEEYIKEYGPVTRQDLQEFNEYTWLKGPWPWEYIERRG